MLETGNVLLYRRVAFDKLGREQYEITKVDRVRARKRRFVDLVDFANLNRAFGAFALFVCSRPRERSLCLREVCRGRDTFVLAPGDGSENVHKLVSRFIQILIVAQRKLIEMLF